MAQCLGSCAFTAKGPSSIPGCGTEILMFMFFNFEASAKKRTLMWMKTVKVNTHDKFHVMKSRWSV